MLAANKQKVLHALGIRVWMKRDRMSRSFVNSLVVIPAKAGIHLSDTSVTSNPADILISQPARKWIPAFAGMTQEKKTRVVEEQRLEVTHEKFVQACIKPFRLILQPLTQNTLIIADAHDVQAPGLSAQEQRLLANFCSATHAWLGLKNPPALVGEAGLFIWPASAHISLLDNSQQAVEQALQGLLAAQENRGFHQFLLLGNSVSNVLVHSLSDEKYAVFASLHTVHQQPLLKKALWQLLMQWIKK